MKSDTALHGQYHFSRDKARILERVSSGFSIKNCTGTLTKHAFYLDGKIGELTSPHLDCDSPPNIPALYHEFYDLAIFTGKCPTTDLLDIGNMADGLLGDDVLTYGYGSQGRVWRGTVSGRNTHVCTEPIKHWSSLNGSVPVCFNELIVEGNQHEGMSGGPSANGCGYVGMFHIVTKGSKGGNFGLAISAKTIVDFIRSKSDMLMSKSDCNHLSVLTLPRNQFGDCLSDNAITECHDYLCQHSIGLK